MRAWKDDRVRHSTQGVISPQRAQDQHHRIAALPTTPAPRKHTRTGTRGHWWVESALSHTPTTRRDTAHLGGLSFGLSAWFSTSIDVENEQRSDESDE
jgi:hypothetical protein